MSAIIAQLAAMFSHNIGRFSDKLLVDVDLGRDFILSGSMATVLCSVILPRRDLDVSYIRFMICGVVIKLTGFILLFLASG